MIDGAPWFVAADVCAALTIANARDAVAKLDDDERKSLKNNSVGITDGLINQQLNAEQEINLINESGLYSLILTSRKPEAKKFKKWVTSAELIALGELADQHFNSYVARDQEFIEAVLRPPVSVRKVRALVRRQTLQPSLSL